MHHRPNIFDLEKLKIKVNNTKTPNSFFGHKSAADLLELQTKMLLNGPSIVELCGWLLLGHILQIFLLILLLAYIKQLTD